MSDIQEPQVGGPPMAVPDPVGHSALLLIESLIHALVSRTVLTVQEAVDIVDTAQEVLCDWNDEHGLKPAARAGSTRALDSILTSLRTDCPK